MYDPPSEKALRREVQPPRRQPTGLGLMLIASTAMFFAVAGSAFVVRARMAGHCCDRTHPTHEVRPIAPLVTGSSTPCGEAIYRANPDGTVSVDFRLCPPEEVDGQASSPGAGPGNASSASRAAPPPGS